MTSSPPFPAPLVMLQADHIDKIRPGERASQLAWTVMRDPAPCQRSYWDSPPPLCPLQAIRAEQNPRGMASGHASTFSQLLAFLIPLAFLSTDPCL